MKPVRLFRRSRQPAPQPMGYCRRFNQLDSRCPLPDTDPYCPLTSECVLARLTPIEPVERRHEA